MPWDATLVMLAFALFVSVSGFAAILYGVRRFEREYGGPGRIGAPPAE
ncbi:hypothetical protein [Methylobacterium nonmethylotrophicum]|nr:hypothetical protein [Methylobacterium nonmethylotrophicum]